MSGLRHGTSLSQQFPHRSGKVMAMSAEGHLGPMLCDSRSADHLSTPLPSGWFSTSPGLRVKLNRLHTVFLGRWRGGPSLCKRPPWAIGKEPGCALNTISNVTVSRKKDQEEKQREKILFGYNWCLQFSTSVLFMNAPNTRQQQRLIQYAPCRKTIRKKIRVFNKHLERL